MRALFTLQAAFVAIAGAGTALAGQPLGYSVPVVDLAGQTQRQVVVDREPGQYLGHPTTVLLEDGHTIYCVYPKGHGRGPIVMKRSDDGGVTWSEPKAVVSHPTAKLCEPGAVRSPDGKRLAVLMREESRRQNSFVIVSDDEGETWSAPAELPGALTGDRHHGIATPDGRLVISFRDMTRESPTKGDWVAWVGTFDDIVQGCEGQYRIRLMDNEDDDCGYAGVELLPDGTIVATTYGHWVSQQPPYIVSVRFKLSETDALAEAR